MCDVDRGADRGTDSCVMWTEGHTDGQIVV